MKNSLFIAIFLAVVLVSPINYQRASAQTINVSAEYQSLIDQLIATLMEQIQILRAQIDAKIAEENALTRLEVQTVKDDVREIRKKESVQAVGVAEEELVNYSASFDEGGENNACLTVKNENGRSLYTLRGDGAWNDEGASLLIGTAEFKSDAKKRGKPEMIVTYTPDFTFSNGSPILVVDGIQSRSLSSGTDSAVMVSNELRHLNFNLRKVTGPISGELTINSVIVGDAEVEGFPRSFDVDIENCE